MSKKSARKGIGNKFTPVDVFNKFNRQRNRNNAPWHNKVKRNKSNKINVEKLDDSR